MADIPNPAKVIFKGLAVIAEDSAANAAALGIFVKQTGLEVRQFGDGQAALEFIESLSDEDFKNLRIVFSDLMMPKLDGYEFLKKLKAHPRNKTVPFIFCSAVLDPSVTKDAVSLADGYLLKPAKLAIVQKKIEAVLKMDKAG